MQLLRDPSRKKLVYSYGFDWMLVVIMTVVFFAIDKITPFHRMFSVEDKTIMFPYTENESVPVWLLLVICFVAPIVVIAIVSLAGVGYKPRSYYDFHSGVLGLCLGLSMTIMLTDVIKITAGRPRPDMLSRCQPPADTVDPLFGLTSVNACTTPIDSHIMIDGFKSFPSGHSSFSFAGLGFLAFYIAGKMKMFDERGHTYKGFMFAFPILGALLVAISRTRDYRHHWQDVTVGAILGTLCAYFAYRQYYPGLSHSNCHDPFLTRMDGCNSAFYDEESNTDHVGLLGSSHNGYHSQTSSRFQLDEEINSNNNNLTGRRNV
ncbi:PAP2-domain-containing protein [Backusella circina FSU 941]|nr:PAP2-domain-containing protein [Backusella circina FSU 941]KAI8887019.1 PAP2-domain-containing protein [Backusella circina FSU 941]